MVKGYRVLMKKFFKSLLTCFIILAVFCGFLFFLGWTQFKIPAKGFGILISKTGGVSEQPVKSGVFSWHWEFLIPTNAQLKIFTLENYSYKNRISGQLSSGDFYNQINKTNADFCYSFDFDIVCKIESENIIKLFSSSHIDDENSLEQYIDNACNDICQLIVAEFFKKLEQDEYVIAETLTSKDYLKLADVKEKYQYIDFLNFSVNNVKLPDYKLYQKLRQKALTFLSEKEITEEKIVSVEKAETINDVSEHSEEKKDDFSSEEDIKLLNKIKSLLTSN